MLSSKPPLPFGDKHPKGKKKKETYQLACCSPPPPAHPEGSKPCLTRFQPQVCPDRPRWGGRESQAHQPHNPSLFKPPELSPYENAGAGRLGPKTWRLATQASGNTCSLIVARLSLYGILIVIRAIARKACLERETKLHFKPSLAERNCINKCGQGLRASGQTRGMDGLQACWWRAVEP